MFSSYRSNQRFDFIRSLVRFVFSRLHLAKRRKGVIERVNERRMEEGEREKMVTKIKKEREKRRGGGCVKATDL